MTKTKWYQKPLYTLVALALVLSLGIVAVPMAATVGASPGQWYVDDSVSPSGDGKSWGTAFKTITEGITAAGTGDTINVAAGTYDSSSETFPIVIGKSLTLLGAQANVDPRPSQGGRTGDESIIDAAETSSAVIQISASDVEINGFTITGGTGDMVEESDSADNLLFCYNILYDDLTTSGDEGIQIKYSDGVVMEYNYAYNICQDAFNLSCSNGGVIRYNEAHDIYSENAAIYMYNDGSGPLNATIEGNLVYNVPNNDGIKLGDKGGRDKELAGGSILNNIVHDTNQDGITVYTSDTLVDGNEVYNSMSENGAVYVGEPVHNVTITNNSIHDNGSSTDGRTTYGIRVGKQSVYPTNVVVHYNSIVGNEKGLFYKFEAGDPALDAENNWWGSVYGPEDTAGTTECLAPSEGGWNCVTCDKNTEPAGLLGDKVSDNVDYCPWLEALPMSEFQIDHAKLDFKNKPNDDKVHVRGTLALDADGVDVSQPVTVTVGPLSDTITMAEKGKKGEKWEYKCPKDGEGIKHMTINWKNGKFDIRMDKADLTGVTNPVTITVQIGDDFGEETIMMREKKHHWDYKAPRH